MKLIKKAQSYQSHINLGAELMGLCRYGRPRISLTESGWHCNIEMNTSADGAVFKVHSEFDHSSPDDALSVCRARAEAAVKKISESANENQQGDMQ